MISRWKWTVLILLVAALIPPIKALSDPTTNADHYSSKSTPESRSLPPNDVHSSTTLRILTLAPNLTEDVFALGFGAQVVGATDYCRYPPEAAKLPHVGGLYNPNLEVILSLRPTLVFLVPSQKTLSQQLQKAGIETVIVKSDVLEDVFSGILIIGKRLKVENRALALIASIQSRLDQIRTQTAALPRKRVLIVVSHSPGALREIYAAGPGNIMDELVARAGGDNVVPKSSVPYPVISKEFILQSSPDVIIDCQYIESGPQLKETQKILKREWVELLGGNRPDAKHTLPKITFASDPHLSIPGPSVADNVASFVPMIHDP